MRLRPNRARRLATNSVWVDAILVDDLRLTRATDLPSAASRSTTPAKESMPPEKRMTSSGENLSLSSPENSR
jgi:hypothetical protein